MTQRRSGAKSQVLFGILALLLSCAPLVVAETAATMATPMPGTKLASSGRFEWNPALPKEHFDGYGLWIGIISGQHDIAEINLPAASTSATVPGLPRAGGQVFVRLWSHVRGSNWIYKDYIYTACVCDVSHAPVAPSSPARVTPASLSEPAADHAGVPAAASATSSVDSETYDIGPLDVFQITASDAPAAPSRPARVTPASLSDAAADHAGMPAAASAASRVDSETYVIGPLDVLQITVWKEPEMSMPAVPVRPDGKISLPLLNDVHVAGLTTLQLNALLTVQMKKFVQDPKVTTGVTVINSKRIYILGEVGHPGPVSMLPDMNVLQALSLAGGLSQYANAKKIYVLRTEPERQRRIRFNYKKALKGSKTQPNILLQPGDTIVVP